MLSWGYSQADITPDKPIETIGFDRGDNISQGVLKPLLAQVSVWKDGEGTYCLVTIDSLGLKKDLCDKLRMLVCEGLDTTFEKVMVCFSHCHSAPNPDAAPEYFEMMCDRIAKAAQNAASQMQEVAVGWDNAYAQIGVNRRHKKGNTDNRVGILKVCDATGSEIKLIILRVTAHCNALKRDNYMISPDYFGAIREVVGAHFNCPVMVVQGAAGNIAPKYFNSQETPIDATGDKYIRSKTALEDAAHVILEAISPVIDALHTTQNSIVQMCAKHTILQAKVPSLEEARKVAEEAKKYCGIDGTSWLAEVQRLNDCGIVAQEEDVEVQYFKIGAWCLCGVPYEIMVEFALKAQDRLQDEFFYFNGYTNGCLSYFPTEEEFDFGGYEVYWSLLIYYPYFNRVFPFVRESATKLIDFVIDNIM